MKKKSLLFIVLLIFIKINAQNNIYQPTWESLDTRPTPAWFKNAKFGIFIHWGIYSVPMWSPKGTYEEWYKYWLDNKKLMGNGEFTGTEIYEILLPNLKHMITMQTLGPNYSKNQVPSM